MKKKEKVEESAQVIAEEIIKEKKEPTIAEKISDKPSVSQITPKDNGSFFKCYQFEIKPRWWHLFGRYGKFRGMNDRIINTEDITITWLGGDRYQVLVRRSPAIIEVKSKTQSEIVDDLGEERFGK
ncbi:MAG: hypothetical protein M0R80_18485 [Proteobacteria bacterium]|jgi:hypothetical protein|nr:hypothetical protein [Pseudomonadota bacterium]